MNVSVCGHCMRINLNAYDFAAAVAVAGAAAAGCILQIGNSFQHPQVYLNELPVEILFTLSGEREETSNKIMLKACIGVRTSERVRAKVT